MRRSILALAVLSGAVLTGCTTIEGGIAGLGASPARSPAGTYLSANFAASQGDLTAAAGFFAQSLKDDPTNQDLLARAFLYTATAGEMDRAIALSDRVVAGDPDNRAARLLRAVAAVRAHNYALARDEASKSASGPFTSLTNALLTAWAYEGEGNTDAALKALQYLSSQGGLQGMYAFQEALILDHAGRAKRRTRPIAKRLAPIPVPAWARLTGGFSSARAKQTKRSRSTRR